MVYVEYSGEGIPMTLRNQVLNSYLRGVLNMIYTKRMREDEGGVYYTSITGGVSELPKVRFNFVIQYTTDPDPVKKEKLKHIVYEEIDRIIKQAPEAEKVEKIRLNLIKGAQEFSSEKTSNYWNFTMAQLLYYGWDRPKDYENLVNSITPQMVSEFAKKIFTQGNVIEVEMDPEKGGPNGEKSK
jgi:zinc protease